MRHINLTAGFLLTSVLALSACQTSSKQKLENLDKVQIGMDKSEVLETTGFGPRSSDRRSGQDRWVFEVYPDRHQSMTVEKEVRFQEGKVIYVGEVQKPAVSAEEQDRLNEASRSDNLVIEDSLRREGRKQSIDLKDEISSSMPQQKFEEIIPADEAPIASPKNNSATSR